MGDQLDQVHIAHGVEEVDAQEAALTIPGKLFPDVGDGDVRGVGADDGVDARVFKDEGHGALLDAEVLGNGLNDKVAVLQQRGLLLHVGGAQGGTDPRLGRALHLTLLQDVVNCFGGPFAAACGPLAADHQDHIQAGARAAGRDGRTHGPGADDRHFTNRLAHKDSFPDE